MYKKQIIVFILGCMMMSNVFGAIENNDPVIRKEINLENNCGGISIDLPEWLKFQNNILNLNKELPSDTIGKVTFTLECNSKDIALNNDITLFNEQTKKWELNSAQWSWSTNKLEQEDVKGSFKLYQLKNENNFGWIVTQIAIGSKENDYTKSLSFCLISSNHLKQLCGGGLVQYIPHRKDLGTSEGDYSGMIIKLIESIRFLSDNH